MLLDIYTFQEQSYIKFSIRLHFLAKILHFPAFFAFYTQKNGEKTIYGFITGRIERPETRVVN